MSPRCWALVLAVLGGAWALPPPLPYPQALAQALDAFNRGPGVQNLFRLLSAHPEPTPDVPLSSLQLLNFTLMETLCPAHGAFRPDTCDFKDDGIVKDCTAPIPPPGGTFQVTCVDSPEDPVQVKRFWPFLAYKIYKAIKKRRG
ncbi:cathelicidin-1-like [Heliangelus exortis]|uniref:cathelicidin-1-like n=1 Tax=Heliangelus exortis TaxID=472823 RepID=UPI003A94F330